MGPRSAVAFAALASAAAAAAEDCAAAVGRCFGPGLAAGVAEPMSTSCVDAVLAACAPAAAPSRPAAAAAAGPRASNCSVCPFTPRAVCCNPNAKPAQSCPGGAPCCDCGGDACDCAASPAPPPPPPHPTPQPQPAPPTPPPPPAPAGTTAWWTKGRMIMRQVGSGGESPYFVKGFAYHAVPKGGDPTNTSNPWFGGDTLDQAADCKRDFPLMRDLGANSIRVYGTNPAFATKGGWRGCLDAAWNGGDRPIAVFMHPWIDGSNWGAAGPSAALVSGFLAVVRGTKSHPAVMGYSFGDEQPPFTVQGFWANLNGFLQVLRKELGSARKLFTAAPPDYQQVQWADAANAQLDVWGFDRYDNDPVTGTTMDALAGLKTAKPGLYMEYGFPMSTRKDDTEGNACRGAPVPIPNTTEAAGRVAAVFSGMTAALRQCWEGKLANPKGGMYPPLVSGGMVFEFAHEWWKAGNPNSHDAGCCPPSTTPQSSCEACAGWVEAWPGHCKDEEWYGVFTIDRKPTPGADYLRREWSMY
eukprot:TRINITY_DN11739_c3_g1_i2.p1 TRINITY_DN11739_c3_g1~~TRINITY_DN11739_c3_g1_i2.p1  ORF type:complete len:551 (+),score=148.52 TRINITY_DN11739_c3_g1_i2:73-1653(+)